MIDRVVAEAVRASSFFGLSGELAQRYASSIQATLPLALDALTEPDPAGRDRKLDALAANVRRVTDEHHVPRMIERGLVSLAFGFARTLMSQHAEGSGFTAEELDRELVAFRDDFEAKLFEY